MSEAPRDGSPILIMQSDGSAAYICAYGQDGDWWSFTGFAMGSTWEAMGTLSEAGYYGWLPLPHKVIDQLQQHTIMALASLSWRANKKPRRVTGARIPSGR
jgi:hypothetical protein